MSSEQNVETIKRMYEAFGRGDVETILGSVTDDVDWAAEPASDSAPWYGHYGSKQDLPRFFSAIDEAIEVLDFTPQSFVADDSEVAALVRWRFRGRQSGREADMQLHHHFRFRDGQVQYFRGAEDSEQTAKVLAGG